MACTVQLHVCLTKSLCSQEVARYLRRHKQELELLLIGSGTMGVEFTEGVMNTAFCSIDFTFTHGYKAGCKCSLTDRFLLILLN